MKIVIIGSGDTGFHLSKMLSEEKHVVTILDHDTDTLQKVNEHCDVLTIKEEGTYTKYFHTSSSNKPFVDPIC